MKKTEATKPGTVFDLRGDKYVAIEDTQDTACDLCAFKDDDDLCGEAPWCCHSFSLETLEFDGEDSDVYFKELR